MGLQHTQEQPYDLNAEKMLVSQLMLDNAVIYQIIDDKLERTDFYDRELGLLYNTIVALIREGKVADNITISDKINSKILEDVLFAAYTTSGCKEYSRIIKEHSIRRWTIDNARVVSSLCYDKEEISEIQKQSDKLLQGCFTSGDDENFLDEIDSYYEDLLEEGADAVKTNYKEIDSALGGGFSRGQLVTIAGRPGMGKSAVMVNLALSMEKAAMFSVEMSKKEIAYRMCSCITQTPYQSFKSGIAGNAELQNIVADGFGKIKKKKVRVYDKKLDIMSIKLEIKKLKMVHGLDIVFIDYLQILRQTDKAMNRTTFIGQITRELKLLAKELDIVVVMGAQLNRDVEKRSVQVPKLSDLRESGDIEQDSDIVLFLHRDIELGDSIDVIIAKHRNGPVGVKSLKFVKETMTMIDKEEVLELATIKEEKKQQTDIYGNKTYF